MKTILIITENPGFAEAVRVAIGNEDHRVFVQPELQPGDPLAKVGQLDACIFDGDLNSVIPIRQIEAMDRIIAQCPFIVYSQSKQWEWEEQAYLLGVMHILAKPVRASILNSILENLWSKRVPKLVNSIHQSEPIRQVPSNQYSESPAIANKTLEVLKHFSELLPHGLSIEALMRQFLLLLRETVSVNRASIFLRPANTSLGRGGKSVDIRKLSPACSNGLEPGLREKVTLSMDAGVGGLISQSGMILRRNSDLVLSNEQACREFDLLGAEVALPILDRESLMGVAFFDKHLTGEALGREELNLLFYMLEGLGMAVRNIWLHQDLTTSHHLLGEILGELKSGCIVVGADLSLLHINPAARTFLGFDTFGSHGLVFRDIPPHLGSKVYDVLQGSLPTPPFRFVLPTRKEFVFQVSVMPFSRNETGLPRAVLMLIEDCTQTERLRQMEIEASNLRMIRTMSERLAHEIGNAIVPLSTHQQLLANNYNDPEFRDSLSVALHDGVKRIGRLGQQMLFLAQDRPRSSERIPVSKLIEEAFREAQKNHGEQPVVLQYDTGGKQLVLNGDKAGLRHALAEIMLNALQANPPSPKVRVDTTEASDALGVNWLKIQVQDSGSGFTSETSQKAPDPFYTTRNVGLGLGLTVSRKIIEMHHGRIEIGVPDEGQTGMVTITLPMNPN